MSFKPNTLDSFALDNLVQSFAHAVSQVSKQEVSSENARSLLLHSLGGSDAQAIPKSNPLQNRVHRKMLWKLMSAQLMSGISIMDALQNIRRQRETLGFPPEFDEVLDQWKKSIVQSNSLGEFFIRHVMPIDFEEGARLALGSRLCSFQDALARETNMR